MSLWIRAIFDSEWISYDWRGEVTQVPYLTLRVLSNCKDVGGASVLKRSLGQSKMWRSWWGSFKALPNLWKRYTCACMCAHKMFLILEGWGILNKACWIFTPLILWWAQKAKFSHPDWTILDAKTASISVQKLIAYPCSCCWIRISCRLTR